MNFDRALFWMAAITAVVAELFILRSAFLGRSGPAHADASTARRVVEVVWTLLPAVALAVVLFFTWRALERSEGALPAFADREPVAIVTST